MSIRLHHPSTFLAAVLTGSLIVSVARISVACISVACVSVACISVACVSVACQTEESASSTSAAEAPAAATGPAAEERAKVDMNTNATQNLYQFSLDTIDGEALSLDQYRGKVALLVNVASECGHTPQYADLQKLYERYQAQGLVVLGVPSNDFGGQEPGSNEEIKAFCESKFDISFPMFSKVTVKGAGQHPLYAWLTKDHGEVTWNFNKFLIGRDGKIVRHFESGVQPLSPELTGAIDAALSGT